MAEANGHDVPRGQVRGRIADESDDYTKPEYKRQKSERTILAGRLGDVQLEGNGTEEKGNENGNRQSEDETDGCAARVLQGFVEDSLNVITRGTLSPQIGLEQDNVTDELFENNIVIRHPERHIDDQIKLGLHLGKHKSDGFIVRKVLEDGLIVGKDIRAGDIVTHVGETDIRQMSLADLQGLFWNLTFETKITLKILRVSESEDETDGVSVRYEELTVHIKATIEDDVVLVTTVIVERSSKYVWGSLSKKYFYISVLVGGNPRYLSAQDNTLKATILTQSDRHNPNYHWKQQFCSNFDDTPYRLLYNVGTRMTVSCCNITSDTPPFIVKMSSKQTFDVGTILESTEQDRLFKGIFVTEGKDNYYLESVLDPAYYMCLSSDPRYENCLEMATESIHPKTEFHFHYPTEQK